MLKVIVEFWPGGRDNGRRVLATAKIGRVKNGAVADYKVELHEDVLGDIGAGTLEEYPRFAAPIWDLVARAVATGLTGKEELPPRPQSLNVPIHEAGNLAYVRFREIPEPALSLFRKRLAYSTQPVIEEDAEPMDCAYAWDWLDFLAGAR